MHSSSLSQSEREEQIESAARVVGHLIVTDHLCKRGLLSLRKKIRDGIPQLPYLVANVGLFLGFYFALFGWFGYALFLHMPFRQAFVMSYDIMFGINDPFGLSPVWAQAYGVLEGYTILFFFPSVLGYAWKRISPRPDTKLVSTIEDLKTTMVRSILTEYAHSAFRDLPEPEYNQLINLGTTVAGQVMTEGATKFWVVLGCATHRAILRLKTLMKSK